MADCIRAVKGWFSSTATCAVLHRDGEGKSGTEPLFAATVSSGTGARRTCLWLLTSMVLIAGCAGIPVEPDGADFQLGGKIGVIEGDRSFSARFSWRQNGARYDIVVWGPLGQGRTRLRGDSEQVEVVGKDGVPVLAGHPEQVMRQRLGWSLPLPVMRWWLNGHPAPHGAPTGRETDAEGRLTAFRQLGWQVAYDRFEAIDGAVLPARITARRPGYRIRVVILTR